MIAEESVMVLMEELVGGKMFIDLFMYYFLNNFPDFNDVRNWTIIGTIKLVILLVKR